LKRIVWGLAVLLAVLALVFWLTFSRSGFHWLAESMTRLSRAQLVIEGVDGHLGMPIRIQKLVFTTGRQRVTLNQLRFEWQPRALLQRRLDINLLAAQTLRVEILKKDRMLPTLPASLRLPVEIRVATWDVAQLDVISAGQTLSFHALHGRLDGVGAHYSMTAAATTPWADMHGQLALDKDAPFKLQGRFVAARSTPMPVQATLDLSGRLAAVSFKIDSQAQSVQTQAMKFLATGIAAPFARVHLPQLLVAGQGIDPKQFSARAPHADLAFSGVFEGQPGERVLGTFSLSNALAGRLDQDRLPLANLTGAVVGDAAHADFSDLSVDLGEAGQFTGDGQWRDGRMAASLSSGHLNLAGIHRNLYPSRIRAALQLAGDAARQTLVADVAETWGHGRLSLSHADAIVRLDEASFSGQVGRAIASGSLGLDASRAFTAVFDATGINPARFGKFPKARLNARGQVSGVLAPALRLQTQFTLPPGELEGRPVKGQGRLRYEDRHLTDADLDLDLAGNRARLKGAYGRPGDRVVWDINAPALARLNLGLAGRLTSTGSASGEPRQPQIDAQIDASGLRLPGDIAVESLNLQASLQASASGTLTGQMEARGVQWAGQHISSARISVRGRRNAHTLALDVSVPDWRLTASLAGGLDAKQIWRGQLNQAEAQGAWPMTLIAPATLVLARDQQQVSNLALMLAGGQINMAQVNRQGAQLATRGSLNNLPLAPLLGLLETRPPLMTDLRVNGDWNLRLGDKLDGQARLVRQSGDVRLTDPAMSLGLTTLALHMQAEANRVTAHLEADTREAGQARLEGHATLERAGTGLGLPRGAAGLILPRSAPLAWTAQINVPDLRLAKPFLPVGTRLDSRLAAQLTGSGSLAAPRIDGQIDASQMRFAMPEEGVAITDGTLKLILADDRVRVKQGELKGQSGRIVVSGEAQLKNPQAGLTLTFEKFAATNRSDRRVTVSGVTRLNLDQKRLQLTGELSADRARLDMPEASRPVLSSDVVIAGQPPREKPVAQRFPLALDLNLKLGDDFQFKGGGLDARLGGQLRVFTLNQVLRGEGTIKVEQGRYAAYAQKLDIERGVLRFAGPIGNPGLDVLAVRKTSTVKAGVQVSGTVQRPVVKLYSDPAMPDTEKLSWLVLGHGLEGGNQQEFVLLQVAAGALLSQSDSVNFQAKLAEALRIDRFDVRGGNSENLASTVVSVGKRLSSRATLNYEQSLDGLSHVVKVLYQLSPHVRLEAQAGQQSSFDAFYSLEFD
jgi:translocation and assembly module TamB